MKKISIYSTIFLVMGMYGSVQAQAAPAGAVTINFDNVVAACSWSLTAGPLGAEYAAQGVTFSGPTAVDGGAIIDQCGAFGVTGYSAPNFLGFNTTGVLQNGGAPIGPETLTFSPAVTLVSINAGSANAGTVTMNAYDAVGTLLGTSSITGAAALQPMSIAAVNISKVVISFTGTVCVLDDLQFVPLPAVGGGGGGCAMNPEASFDPLLGMLVLLAAGFLLRRRFMA